MSLNQLAHDVLSLSNEQVGAHDNKSKFFSTSATIASRCLRGPESALNDIPPFRPHFIKFSKTVIIK